MPDYYGKIIQLIDEFDDCGKLLQALGDETRQRIILQMLQMRQCSGV